MLVPWGYVKQLDLNVFLAGTLLVILRHHPEYGKF